MILTHPIYRLLKQVLQKTAWEPSLHLLFCFSPQYSESTKPQLRGRCFSRDHALMNCEKAPTPFPQLTLQMCWGMGRIVCTPLQCKAFRHGHLLESCGAECNAECQGIPPQHPSVQCTSILLLPACFPHLPAAPSPQ